MKRLSLVKSAALVVAASVAWTAPSTAQSTTAPAVGQNSNTNREIIRAAFEAWAAGGSTFFEDVLAPDVRWTILGSGPTARTYVGRDNFVREASAR
jgi:hypothetical protein